MKTYESLIRELDENQRLASRIGTNAVIAAGAGSGKTRVLAARYVYLVIEKEIPVDEILALTFTKKAASEMYARIYSTLREIDHPLARRAIESFHLARINTIDAFCNSIARSACRSYGISPDFEIDNKQAQVLAEELALPFFLENRTSAAIRQFMKKYTLAELSPSLFADTMVRFSPVSSPLDFDAFRAVQKAEIESRFPRAAEAILRAMLAIRELPPAKGKTWEQVSLALKEIPDMPESGDRDSITAFIKSCAALVRVRSPGNVTDETLVVLKEYLADFKETLHPEFLALANAVLNDAFIHETFRLLAEFQVLFHKRKRAANIMTFADVSRLALDALISDPSLRSSYKDSTRALMIDEFQDNNAMQRNLLFLIAEKKDRMEKSVPEPHELCPDKLFFVGDEKQSIYRFRGADVSVFRELARDLSCPDSPELGTNYRTERPLIGIFNAVFPHVFLNPAYFAESEFPPYEASFGAIGASRETGGVASAMDILLVNEDNFSDADPSLLDAPNTEAAEVAARIRHLVDSLFPVRGEKGPRPCVWGDFAILFRSGTRQHYFEKHLRANGIPYQAESLRGLFSDAPINDMYALLRLAVYPADNTAYATVLRSPFVTVSDEGFALAVMRRTEEAAGGPAMPPPFSEDMDSLLSAEDRRRFARGRELYLGIREKADRIPAADIVTHVWYTEGYRYAVLSDGALHRYAELYDYFFELARQADRAGETLATFLDRIADLMRTGDKIEDLDIPVDKSGGVRLMTIHKSKGLEFPVVFLVDCGNNGNADRNAAPVYYSAETGISVNTGKAEDAGDACENYFYLKGREEEKNKGQAEIRRLLYVAMTRAETRLFVSGTFKAGGDSVEESRAGGDLAPAISAWLEKKDENADKKGTTVFKRSFFDFLLPAFGAGIPEGTTLTEIMPRLRRAETAPENVPEKAVAVPNGAQIDLFAAAEKKETADTLYERTPTAKYELAERTKYSATSLHALREESAAVRAGETEAADESGLRHDALDILLKKTETSAADFGIFAHRTIEARFTGFPVFMSEELRPAAEKMADVFFASELGRKAAEASWRESEYGLITRYEFGGKTLTVTAQIDLIFEYDNKVYVVDYKTDRMENAELHAEQLAAYRKAAYDLRGKETETWLFYLRSGNAVRSDAD